MSGDYGRPVSPEASEQATIAGMAIIFSYNLAKPGVMVNP
jgi:hypothetical protein